ncbi:MAG: hypothetical protein H6729_09435 [Deltaproteobacteria bacterium]|nr:hypothetical protein [Deltaproteobacteria bacterium]
MQSVLDGPGPVPQDADKAYAALVARLYALSRSGTHLGLGRIAQALVDLGHPEVGRPVVHVAGSNGKGSVCAFLASILSAFGRRRVGLYTSPHLVSLTERVQIVEDAIARAVSRDDLMAAIQEVEVVAPEFSDLTFFEVITAAGLVCLKAAGSELDVIEAGLGARLDATRLVPARVSVLTDLSLEHTEYLGPTIEAIAGEEGEVMRPGRPLVCADGPPAAMAVIDRRAQALGVDVYRIGTAMRCETTAPDVHRFRLSTMDAPKDLRGCDGSSARVVEGIELSLLGPHQARNGLLAAQAALLIDPDVSDDAIREGLRRARWPGRMEVVRPAGPWRAPILLDGAHNAQGAEVLAAALRADRTRFAGPLHFVFAVMRDKDVATMLTHLLPLAARFTVVSIGTPRCADPSDVLAMADARFRDRIALGSDLEEALLTASESAFTDHGWVVAAGSLYLVGALKALLHA